VAAPSPACPSCLGQSSIITTGGVDTCEGCRKKWPTVGNALCGRIATTQIINKSGGTVCVCDAHAVLARRQITDVAITTLFAGVLRTTG
jgi:hypothetical protein